MILPRSSKANLKILPETQLSIRRLTNNFPVLSSLGSQAGFSSGVQERPKAGSQAGVQERAKARVQERSQAGPQARVQKCSQTGNYTTKSHPYFFQIMRLHHLVGGSTGPG